jgi:hypothetical protein
MDMMRQFGIEGAVEVYDRATVNHFGGAWCVYASMGDQLRMGDQSEKVLVMSTEPGITARWIHDFERLRGNMPALPTF